MKCPPPGRPRAPRIARSAVAATAIAAASTAVGCGGERAAEPAPASPRVGEPGPPEGERRPAEPGARDGGAPLDEASARHFIATRLRAAGLRVIADVSLREDGLEVTLDGFDPGRRIGYEYIAADERGADLDAGERARLADLAGTRVLIIDSAAAEEVASAVERFLAHAGAAESQGRGAPAPE